jgi:glutaredoxin 2
MGLYIYDYFPYGVSTSMTWRMSGDPYLEQTTAFI